MSKRELMAAIYLSGDGLEIGALHNPLPVPREARVRYVDYAPPEELRRQYGDLEFKTPDIVDDGNRLESIGDCSQDFLIACQMIEHCEDPIGAIKNWLRVLKPGGVLFVSIPDRRFTFDFYRPVTSLEHLLRVHEEGTDVLRDVHFEEHFRDIVGLEDETLIRSEAARQRDEIGNTHFHVWTQLEMFELVVGLRTRLGFDFEVESFCASGFEAIFILRKGAREDREGAEESLRAFRAQHFGERLNPV